MGSNETVEAPDFDRIKKETGTATYDAIITLWRVANSEAKSRRTADRLAIDRFEKKTLISSPGVSQNDFDTEDVAIVRFDGSSAVNITGFRARPEGAIIIVFVIGSATITLKHNSGSSEARDRLLFQSGADLAVTTNKGCILLYQNTRWRELKLA